MEDGSLKGEALWPLRTQRRGGLWRHELVREEHSCQTSSFHREGETSCGEAVSAGYGLKASKAETRTKEPLCGVWGVELPLALSGVSREDCLPGPTHSGITR